VFWDFIERRMLEQKSDRERTFDFSLKNYTNPEICEDYLYQDLQMFCIFPDMRVAGVTPSQIRQETTALKHSGAASNTGKYKPQYQLTVPVISH
jgi:hypothetical protein